MSEGPATVAVDLAAEEAVLGAMMVAPLAIDACLGDAGLRSEHYYRPRHRLIHEAIVALYGTEAPIDALTVTDRLSVEGKLAEVGDRNLIGSLAANTPAPGNAGYYAGIIVEQARLRQIHELAVRIQQRIAGHKGGSSAELLEEVEAGAVELMGDADEDGLVALEEIVGDAIDRLEDRQAGRGVDGLATGFPGLDRMLQGLAPGRLVVVASRPGHGKSTLSINIADHIARKERKAVAFFSLEMTQEEIADKLISSRGLVHGDRLAEGSLEQADVGKVLEAANDLASAPLFIDDTSRTTLSRIRAGCRRLAARLGDELGLVVVDYLQLIEPAHRSRDSNRVAEVSELSRGLKVLAGELGVPMLVCAQLNRGPELRNDHRPLLADLRESGSIESDANQVVLLYNEAMYGDEEAGDGFFSDDRPGPSKSTPGTVEAIVAKNRHNATGVCELVFQGHYSRFLEAKAGEAA